MKAKTDPRHIARKLALCSVFCWLFSDPNHEECMKLSSNLLDLEPGDVDLGLTNKIVEGVTNNLKAIDKIIQKAAPEWPIDKISKIDLVILRIAIFEIVFGKSVPEKVAIDEAVELAKEFGNDTSSKFVNGVLGSVVSTKSESITINSLI